MLLVFTYKGIVPGKFHNMKLQEVAKIRQLSYALIVKNVCDSLLDLFNQFSIEVLTVISKKTHAPHKGINLG